MATSLPQVHHGCCTGTHGAVQAMHAPSCPQRVTSARCAERLVGWRHARYCRIAWSNSRANASSSSSPMENGSGAAAFAAEVGALAAILACIWLRACAQAACPWLKVSVG